MNHLIYLITCKNWILWKKTKKKPKIGKIPRKKSLGILPINQSINQFWFSLINSEVKGIFHLKDNFHLKFLEIMVLFNTTLNTTKCSVVWVSKWYSPQSSTETTELSIKSIEILKNCFFLIYKQWFFFKKITFFY